MSDTTASAPLGVAAGRQLRALFRRPEAGVVLVILVLGAFLTIANPRFLSIANIMNIR